ncbi:hypothetical protein SNE40_002566 [Patella caerulea]|uniref:Serine protease n=2 Tax=Patella caerulea TaxID=87958 RepID=A0AAN8Q3A2_PATCE
MRARTMTELPEFKREVATEADMEGEANCEKNPGHNGFIPFQDFSMDHLPLVWQEGRVYEYIRSFGERVVRLVVKCDNGSFRYGSGVVEKWEDKYVIATNNHVIENDSQAKRCLIEFNFNSDDRSDVIVCEGTGLLETSKTLDKTLITFLHIPKKIQEIYMVDESLFIPEVVTMDNDGQTYSYQSLTMPYTVNGLPILAMPLRFDLNKMKETSIEFYDGTVSKMASEIIKFEPVPSEIEPRNPNVKDIHPNISVRDINGQVKTMTGNIEYIEGEVFIKLPEAFTDEEAQQCTVTFPNGSVSKGTGVHFLPTTLATANLQGLDINIGKLLTLGIPEIKRFANNPFWNLHFKPTPPGLENQLSIQGTYNTEERRQINTAIAIGHPHGGKKMVTIGRDLAFSLEPTATELRCSIAYSCQTCPGSSGSPILYLRSWRWYVHCLGLRANEFQEEVVETGNINKAWWWKQYISDIVVEEHM